MRHHQELNPHRFCWVYEFNCVNITTSIIRWESTVYSCRLPSDDQLGILDGWCANYWVPTQLGSSLILPSTVCGQFCPPKKIKQETLVQVKLEKTTAYNHQVHHPFDCYPPLNCSTIYSFDYNKKKKKN